MSLQKLHNPPRGWRAKRDNFWYDLLGLHEDISWGFPDKKVKHHIYLHK
jgi:hypothetical protein